MKLYREQMEEEKANKEEQRRLKLQSQFCIRHIQI